MLSTRSHTKVNHASQPMASCHAVKSHPPPPWLELRQTSRYDRREANSKRMVKSAAL